MFQLQTSVNGPELLLWTADGRAVSQRPLMVESHQQQAVKNYNIVIL